MEEPLNGNGNVDSASAKAETEEDPAIGPGPAPRSRPKRPLQFEQAYLDTIPSANMYFFLSLFLSRFRALQYLSSQLLLLIIGHFDC